jgi:hypothetical protein
MKTLRHHASHALPEHMRTIVWCASHVAMANILSGSRNIALLVLLASFDPAQLRLAKRVLLDNPQ